MSEQRGAESGAAPTEAADSSGRSVIAVIGIDRYHHWSRLTNAVRDATGALKLFRRLGFEAFTQPLLDERATGSAIQSLVTDDLRSLGQNDKLVLFYAGHGGTRKHQVGDRVIKTGYLVPVDASRSEDEVASWIDLEGWLRTVSLLPPRHILVLLDACHAGIALDSISKWRDIASWEGKAQSPLTLRGSRRIITSALDDQVALDSGPVTGHSLFTGCLIEALTHGLARAGRRHATGSEIGLYVQQRVQTYPGARQTPDFGAFQYDGRGELMISLVHDEQALAERSSESEPNTEMAPETDSPLVKAAKPEPPVARAESANVAPSGNTANSQQHEVPVAVRPTQVATASTTLRISEQSRGPVGRLIRVIIQRLRAAVADGQGAFLTAMLCFGAAVYLFHLSQLPQRKSQQYLEDTIGVVHEPLRGEPHPVLAGLLLPRREGEGLFLCQRGESTDFLDGLDNDYLDFQKTYLAIPRGTTPTEGVPLVPADARTEVHLKRSPPGTPSKYALSELKKQAETGGVGWAWTDNTDASTLIVPSIVAAAARSAHIQVSQDCSAQAEHFGVSGCKVYALYREPIIRSLAIEKLKGSIKAQHPPYDSCGVTSWYFISVDGVERSVPEWKSPEVVTADRLYNGTSYFYAALANTNTKQKWAPALAGGSAAVFRVATNPYFDLTGGGVIQTVCYRVTQPDTSKPQPDTSKPAVMGVLCADLSLPRRLIMAQLEEASSTLDLSVMKVDGDQVQLCSEWQKPCSASLSRIRGDDARNMARIVMKHGEDKDDNNLILGIEDVQTQNGYFGIIVASGAKNEKLVVIGRMRRSSYRDTVSLVGSSLFLLVGACVLMMSYRHQLRRREAVLARGLPHGVLRLDDRARILGANDRAQEIFDRTLPRLGIDAITDDDPHAVSFLVLFATERCVLVSNDDVRGEFAGQVDKLDDGGFLAPGRTSEALLRIVRGHAVSFYARTSVRWVRVDGSPIVMPDLRVGMVVIVNTHLESAHRPHLDAFKIRVNAFPSSLP
jgi:uncharacterized caspase-like protein